MPVPLHNSIVHSMVSYLYILVPLQPFHIYFAFFSNSGFYYTVFSHYKRQKSACSASGKTDIRQGSNNHQAVVKQSSGSG